MIEGEKPIIVFKCSVDGGTARYGQQSDLIPIPYAVLTPCSQEYAKTCILYRNRRAEIERARVYYFLADMNLAPDVNEDDF